MTVPACERLLGWLWVFAARRDAEDLERANRALRRKRMGSRSLKAGSTRTRRANAIGVWPATFEMIGRGTRDGERTGYRANSGRIRLQTRGNRAVQARSTSQKLALDQISKWYLKR